MDDDDLDDTDDADDADDLDAVIRDEESEEEEFLGFLAADFAEDGKLNFFGVFDVDLLDITPDETFPF